MKRRNFLKGLAALAATAVVAPATLAETPQPAPPAKVPGPFKRPDDPKGQFDAIQKMKAAMKNMGEASQSATKAAAEMRDRLKELYISPEAIEDIRNWGVDQVDETTRREVMMCHDMGVVSDETTHKMFGVAQVTNEPNLNDDIIFSDDKANPYATHMNHWEITHDMDREEINELGRKSPYHKYVSFPVHVTEPVAILDNREILKVEFDG